jgi:hypothetical protein
MAWRLERRLIRLKTGQDGLQQAAAALTAAVTRAEASVRTLRVDGAEAARELETLIARARGAADELRLLNPGGARRASAAAPGPDDNVRRLPSAPRPVEADLLDRLRSVR